MGCIPIVLKYDDNNDAFRDLPILFIDNYEEFITLTEDQLNNIWNEMIIKKPSQGKKITKEQFEEIGIGAMDNFKKSFK